jgi:hypothetical protein
MNKTVLADKTLQGIDIQYVEEALEPSPAPEASPLRQFVRKPVFLLAAALLVCLIAGGVFATVYFHHFKETPTEGTPTQMAEENTAPKQYLVRLISEGNAGEKAINMESDLSYGSFASKTAPKELTVTFQGKEYTGSYWMSEKLPGSGIVRDEYHVGSDASFAVSSADQTLLYMDINVLSEYGLSGTDWDAWEMAQPVLSITEIKRLAVSYAQELVSLDDYSAKLEIRKGPTVLGPSSEPPHADLYEYTFCGTVQGLETTDQVSVLISDRGIFRYVSALAPGWVGEHRGELLSFDVNAATEAAKEASHLTNPTVKARRFGIDENGKVFLMLFLTGANDETPLLLGVSEE